MNRLVKKLGKLGATFMQGGPREVVDEIRLARHRLDQKKRYRMWVAGHSTFSGNRLVKLAERVARLDHHPLISIVLPVYNIDEKWLRLCIHSVIAQVYQNWELCIADDNSSAAHIKPLLTQYAQQDPRIKVVFREENGHISAASNSALAMTTGEFTVLLDHDDEITPDALYHVARVINTHPDVKMIYSDEDLIDENGERSDPKFKPDWSRDLFYSLNLITHLSAYKTALLKKLGGFTVGLDGSQDYDLALRVIENISDGQIFHIPRILYHWRAIGTSVAADGGAKPYAYEMAREALKRHFGRLGKKVTVSRAADNLNRVSYQLPAEVSASIILLPSESPDSRAIKRLRSATDLKNIEIIRANWSGSLPIDLNEAVSRAAGDVICFIDQELLPLSNDWLAEMASFAVQPEIGAVGGKILDRRLRVLSAGTLIGVDGLTSAANIGLSRADNGYFYRASLVGNFSAVAVDLLAMRRELFLNSGGFDAAFSEDYFDTDLCLRLLASGLRNVFTPYAEASLLRSIRRFYHPQNRDDAKLFAARWQKYIDDDPFYNPNLSRRIPSFSIEV